MESSSRARSEPARRLPTARRLRRPHWQVNHNEGDSAQLTRASDQHDVMVISHQHFQQVARAHGLGRRHKDAPEVRPRRWRRRRRRHACCPGNHGAQLLVHKVVKHGALRSVKSEAKPVSCPTRWPAMQLTSAPGARSRAGHRLALPAGPFRQFIGLPRAGKGGGASRALTSGGKATALNSATHHLEKAARWSMFCRSRTAGAACIGHWCAEC
jgi:hypothetical protein